MNKNKLILAISLALTLSGIAATQNSQSNNIDTVILASTDNYPDALMSGAPSKKLGLPILLTKKESLSTETETAMKNTDPNNVVIVGGPAVISDEIQKDLEETRNVTRLWGTTKIGTSVELSNYFWTEGAEKATIIQYSEDDEAAHKMMAAVKNEVNGDSPVLISKAGTLSASVLSEVEELGANEVEVYSTNAVNVSSDLTDIGVAEVEVNENSSDQISDDLNDEVETEGKSELVIVAASNFRDSISIPSSANSASMIISSKSQIQKAIDAADNLSSDTEIKIVGNPELAGIIATRIESKIDADVSVVSGPSEKSAAEEAEEDREEWEKTQRLRLGDWKKEVESSAELQEKANRSIQEAENRVSDHSSEKLREMLQEAREKFEEGDYFEARKIAIRASSNADVEAFGKMSSEEIRDEAKSEKEDLREAANGLREGSNEIAIELKEAKSTEERLKIIREHKEEQREVLSDLRDAARERRSDRNKNYEEKEDENETEEENSESSIDVGNSSLEMELDGNILEIDAKYTGNTGGYTVKKSSSVQNGTINAKFNFKSPNGPVTQIIKEYESEVERSLEDGDYRLNADLMVDGETKIQLNEEISASSTAEAEASVSNQ